MFKPARWRSDKNKIKAVFKLQFHVTQMSELGADALMVSVAPADAGKPAVRSEKATVRDGSCHWENPVYETVKFVQDPKTGKIQQRLYHFLLLTRSSKSGVVGEVSIDFANYAEATKVSSVSLPLKKSASSGVLHVSILRMQESADQRNVEDSESNFHSQDRSLRAQLNNGDTDASSKNNSTEDIPPSKIITHVPELNGNLRTYSGSDVTDSSSRSSIGLDTPTEFRIMNGNVPKNPNSLLSPRNKDPVYQKLTSEAEETIYKEYHRSQWEWLADSVPDLSTDGSSGSPRETIFRESSQEVSESTIENLKSEVALFARQAEVSELELRTLRKQIVKENKRGNDLSKELTILKKERDDLKEECEKFKDIQNHMNQEKVINQSRYNGGDPWTLIEELRQELDYQKDLNTNLRLQLQKTQESNSELLLAVQDFEEMLEEKKMELLEFSNQSATAKAVKESVETDLKSESENDEEQKALEELVRQHTYAKDTYILEQKMMDLNGEIEIYRRDKEELEMQMEQVALEYEILKQENHDISYKLEQSQLQEQLKMQYECSSSYATFSELEAQIESLENELKSQSKEFSDSLVVIKELESHVQNLEAELENQARDFEADLESLMRSKIEQEHRAIQAEETLRYMRLSNTKTAERLQEELNRLSMQMESSFDANEKLTMKTLAEANELRQQKIQLEEILQKTRKELLSVRNDYEEQLQKLSEQISSKTNLINQMQSEIDHKSMLLEHKKKHNKDGHRLLSQEVQSLRAEIEKLYVEKDILSEQVQENESLKAELEKMEKTNKETEKLLEKGNIERQELDSTIAMVKMEAESFLKEFDVVKSLKDEKMLVIETLQKDVESLKAECNRLKLAVSEDEREKENLRKQIVQLKSDIERKEDSFKSIEKRLKDSNRQKTISEGARVSPKSNRSTAAHCPKEVACLKGKIKFLEGQIKEKEIALETSTSSFLEKEKILENKIDELDRRMDELNQSSIGIPKHEHHEVCEGESNDPSKGRMKGEYMNAAENLMISNDDKLVQKELEASETDAKSKRYLEKLLIEISSLNDKNKMMEDELKEMQGRYSDISLRFAEVEGERQQLIMTLRNLKNARKS